MVYRVEQSPRFEGALFETLDYLTSKLRSDSAAQNFVEEVDLLQELLAATPFIKAVSQKPFLAKRNLREYYLSNYVVLYCVEETTVTLVNLFHQSQDYADPRHWGD